MAKARLVRCSLRLLCLALLVFSTGFVGCKQRERAKQWLAKKKTNARVWLDKKKDKAKQWMAKSKRRGAFAGAICTGDQKAFDKGLKALGPHKALPVRWLVASFAQSLAKSPKELILPFLKHRQLKKAFAHHRVWCKHKDKIASQENASYWKSIKNKPWLALEGHAFTTYKAPQALHLAALFCRIGMLKQLLKRKADPRAKDLRGFTPLHYASCPKAVEVLLAHKVDVRAKSQFGLTPLHVALTRKIVKQLIKAGAKLHGKDQCGNTPLHTSVSLGYSGSPTYFALKSYHLLGKKGKQAKASSKPALRSKAKAQPQAKAPSKPQARVMGKPTARPTSQPKKDPVHISDAFFILLGRNPKMEPHIVRGFMDRVAWELETTKSLVKLGANRKLRNDRGYIPMAMYLKIYALPAAKGAAFFWKAKQYGKAVLYVVPVRH